MVTKAYKRAITLIETSCGGCWETIEVVAEGDGVVEVNLLSPHKREAGTSIRRRLTAAINAFVHQPREWWVWLSKPEQVDFLISALQEAKGNAWPKGGIIPTKWDDGDKMPVRTTEGTESSESASTG